MAGPRDLDPFLDGLDYPMFVVTVSGRDGGARAGCLVGFVTQCSIEPARLLVCLSKRNQTCRVARTSGSLALHALAEDQHELARLFGEQTGDDVDKFGRCSWRPGPDGLPLLSDCPRRVVGRVLQQVDLGDHVGFLLEPDEVSAPRQRPPLTFSAVRDLSAGRPA